MSRSRILRRSILAALVVLLGVVVFANGWGTFATDIKPEVYLAPGRMLADYLSAWTFGPYLGAASFNVGLAPVVAVTAALREIGLSPEATFKAVRFGLLLLAAWGAARFYRRLADAPLGGWVPQTAAAVAYVANPFTVVAGSTLAVLLPYSLLPWQLLFLVRALEERRGWRWPAAFALTFFAMSGMNAGVIPLIQLLAVIPVAVVVRRRRDIPWRSILDVLARCAALVVAVSLYWIVPAVAAVQTGATIVANSETVEGIAQVSSYAEVLRGQGLWSLYGRGPDGPWLPEFSSYLTNPAVVLISYLWAAVALLAVAIGHGTRARLGILLAGLAAVVMVGVHPPQHPSPFGAGLRWAFENVPVFGAFRTTHKIGAVLVLGFSLLLAGAAGWLLTRARAKPARAVFVGYGLIVGIIGLTLPAWTGHLYTSPLDVPTYWKQAATAVDQGAGDQRVWLLPGQVRPHYRWTEERPDDLTNSLLDRPALIAETTPNTSAHGSNLLTAVDQTVQSQAMPAGGLSSAARYLGVGDLLVRNDVVWEDAGGARPAAVQEVINNDPGLHAVQNFGRPGQNVLSPDIPPLDYAEATLPPLQRYAVSDAVGMVRAEPVRGTMVVDGDGWALPAMQRAGLLEHRPSFRYALDLTPAEFRRILGPEHRIVVTDTNRRRASVSNRLVNGQGPLLSAEQATGNTRTLGDDAAEQTVLRTEGGSAVASAVGGAFFTVPYGAAENAVDGDPRTGWVFGDFRNAPGNTLDISFDRAVDLDQIHLQQLPMGSVRLDEVRVSAAGQTRVVQLPDTGSVAAGLPGVHTQHLNIEVVSVRGAGFNLVGLAEVGIPGVRVSRVARAPVTVANLARTLGPSDQQRLADTPLDVLLTRQRGAPAETDDEEVDLLRDFTLPDARTFRVRGEVAADDLPEAELDRLAGAVGTVSATSSSRWFDLPEARASAAFDGAADTAWQPGRQVVGESVVVTGPRQELASLRISQQVDRRQPDANWATRVRVEAGGATVAEADVGPGLTTVSFPPVTTESVRVTVLDTARPATEGRVRISEIDAGWRMVFEPSRAARACATVAILDGQPLRMRPAGPVAFATGEVAEWIGCSRLALAAGEHRLREASAYTVDSLDLRDVQGIRKPAASTQPDVSARPGTGARMSISVGAASEPYWLVLGQGFDPRWRASMDGESLGPPLIVDGYSAAWLVTESGPHEFQVIFGPQIASDVALAVSAMAILLCLAMALRRSPLLPLADRPDGGQLSPPPPGASAALGGSNGRPRNSVRSAPARLAGLMGLILGAWLLLGFIGAVGAVALGLWHLVRPPRPRALIVAGAALVMAAGVAFIVGAGDLWGEVSSDLVTKNPWPHWLAAAGLTSVLVGAWRQFQLEEGERANAPR